MGAKQSSSARSRRSPSAASSPKSASRRASRSTRWATRSTPTHTRSIAAFARRTPSTTAVSSTVGCSRYADVDAALRDPAKYSSDERKQLGFEKNRQRALEKGIIDETDTETFSMLRIDPPDHTCRGRSSAAPSHAAHR